jgi:HEAT repeat protein
MLRIPPETFERFVADLQDPNTDPFKLACAAFALGELGDYRAIVPLVAALDYISPTFIGVAAIQKFGEAALEPLIKVFGTYIASADFDSFAHQATVQALGNFGDKALPYLLKFLQVGSEYNQEALVQQLGYCKSWTAVETLIQIMREADLTVNSLLDSAALALVRIGNPVGKVAVLEIAAQVKDLEHHVKLLEALHLIGNETAIGLLTVAVQKPDLSIENQHRLIKSLAIPDSLAAAQILLDLYMQPQHDIIWCDLEEGLLTIGEVAANPIFEEMQHLNMGKRLLLNEMLAGLGDPRAITTLVKFLIEVESTICEDEDEDEDEIRFPIFYLLKKPIKATAAIEPLLQILETENIKLKRAAVLVLGVCLDSRAFEPLIKLLPIKAIRREVIVALGNLGDKRAVSYILPYLQDPHLETVVQDFFFFDFGRDPLTTIGMQTIQVLGKLANPQAVEILIACLTTEHREIRASAASALAQIGDKKAALPLLQAMQAEREVAEEWLDYGEYSFKAQSAMAVALGVLGVEQAIEPLLKLLDTQDPELNRFAAYALLRMELALKIEIFEPSLKLQSKATRLRTIENLTHIYPANQKELLEMGLARKISIVNNHPLGVQIVPSKIAPTEKLAEYYLGLEDGQPLAVLEQIANNETHWDLEERLAAQVASIIYRHNQQFCEDYCQPKAKA